jgi:16S rRNA G1207 methylase RsmC
MNRLTTCLQPGRRSGPPSRNAVVMPATLLRYQPQLQQLADTLPPGTTVVVLGPRHQLVGQALTAPIKAGGRADGRR